MNQEPKRCKADKKIRSVVQGLKTLYIFRPEFKKLDELFGNHLAERRADEADGVFLKARGIMLVGPSGSGKTAAINQLVLKYSSLMSTDKDQEQCEYIGLKVPSPPSLKVVGAETLRALGYPYSGTKQGPAIWDQVKVQLRLRGTKFLSFDEAQDLARYQTDKERQSVVNTMKSLMENSSWPVNLLLAGMPELKKIVNQDPQLARRLDPIEIGRLHSIRDVGGVLKLVRKYADRARVGVDASVQNEAFARRLMHAADYQFGLLAELVVRALSHGLFSEGFEAKLNVGHFAAVFCERNGADDWMNVFLAEDYGRINPRLLLENGYEERESLL